MKVYDVYFNLHRTPGFSWMVRELGGTAVAYSEVEFLRPAVTHHHPELPHGIHPTAWIRCVGVLRVEGKKAFIE